MRKVSIHRTAVLLILLTAIGCSAPSAPILDRSGDRDLAILLEKRRAAAALPALAGAVVIDGKLKAVAAVGTRKAGTNNWVSVDDRFVIGSCGKAFTAVLAARLVEEGVLGWKTTIGEVFPGIQLPPGYADLDFQQLLSHRAGLLKSFKARLDTSKTYTWTSGRREYLKQLSGQAFVHPPGSALFYSNAGYILAGHMMEQVSGNAFMALMAEKVFEPLGLASAGYGAPAG